MTAFNHPEATPRTGSASPEGGAADRSFSMDGRKVLVTGASSGIGAAIAVRLAAAGANVAAVSRSGRVPGDALDTGAGTITAVVADLSDRAQVDTVVHRAVDALGGLDTVVNNAGRGDWLPNASLTEDFFDAMIGLNLWAPLRICQHAHPHLGAAAASGQDAAVVMIGSVDAVRPSAGSTVYGATKAALGAVTVALAKEWAAELIRVTQVNPGLVHTTMSQAMIAELDTAGVSVNIAGRPGHPDEIAALVHYLVAPAGRFATGASYRVDGGALAQGPFDHNT